MEIEYRKESCRICGKNKTVIVIKDGMITKSICCKRCFKEINDKEKIIK